MKIWITGLLFGIFLQLNSQEIPVSIYEKDIYHFLDEMATAKLIVINQSIKPYSRKTVAGFLIELDKSKERLSKRQQKELDWYLAEFQQEVKQSPKKSGNLNLFKADSDTRISLHPLGVFHSDSISYLALKPVLGVNYSFNDKGSMYHRWVGAEAYGSVKNFGFYASLRDNQESIIISKSAYLTDRTGGNYKGLDYSEMIGGITYSNDWLALGLVKDFYTVGTNHSGSNIISDRAPSFAQLKFKLMPWRWFEFNYMHGWLISNVIDSTHSYVLNDGLKRDVLHKKYIATNMFTFRPWRTLNLSFGNSVVYSDYQLNPGYLIPFMFYKSVDHSNNSTDGAGKNVGQNSSMFFDVSFRGIPHLHLYHVQFIDELKFARWTEPDEHNFYSHKTGMQVSNWPIENVFFTAEYTRTVPVTYQHDIATTTYQSNAYNIGHYMRDNSDVLFFELRYHPLKNLNLTGSYRLERKGEEYGYIRSSNELTRHPFMDEVLYKRSLTTLGVDYEPSYGLHLFLNAIFSSTEGDLQDRYIPNYLKGSLFSISTGINFGF